MTDELAPTAPAPGWFQSRAARHPLATFLALVFGLGIPVLAIPALVNHLVRPANPWPAEPFLLVLVLLVMLPAAYFVTQASDGRAAARQLLLRAVRWRFGAFWWAVVLLGLPVATVLVGLGAGATLSLADVIDRLPGQLISILTSMLIINLWEETAWAGFFQTRLTPRYGVVGAAAITAIPFVGIHVPLEFIGDFSLTSVAKGVATLLLFAVPVRLLFGLTMHGARESILAVGLMHAIFNATVNPDGLLGGLMHGVRVEFCMLGAVVVLVLILGLAGRRRTPAPA